MTFNTDQLAIIEAARPIWDGYLKTQTINTGQREIADLRALYDETLGQSGKYPEWSGGCIACVCNCIARLFEIADGQAKPKKKTKDLEAATIASDEQPEPKAKGKAPKKR